MDIKSFMLGYNAGASKSGGNVSQAELEAAIRQEVNTQMADYDKSTAVNNKISSHNTSTESHDDLRLELQRLADRLNAALNSDDTSLDDLKEIVAYIKSNKTLIDYITSSKVNVADIVNNLTTNSANVPLSAAQGVALKLLIDSLEEIVEGKVTAEQVAAQISEALSGYLTPTTGDQRYADKTTTETALTEHGEKIAELEEALENATIEFAESVEWLEANGDTKKKYYLPDGYEYAWMQKLVDVVHNANDGKGTTNARCGTEALTITDGVVTSAPVITTSAAGCFITWPIDVKPESKSSPYNCTISGIDRIVPNYYDRLIYLHYYKTDGTCITYKNDVAIGIASAETALPLTIDLAAPVGSDWDNVRYIRMTIGVKAKNTSITASDIANLVINIPALDHTEAVWGWYSTGIKVNDDETTKQNTADIADLKERMGVVEDALGEIDSGPLFAKLGLIGDSLTAQEYQRWQELAVSMLGGPVLHKNAIVGSCVATYEGYDKPSFVERYLDTPEDCDCIVIMGGTNDSTYKGGKDMGEVGVLNNNTYKGAYSTIIEGLLTRNPATRVMLMTPPRSYTTNYEERTVTKDYAEATVEVAKYYGLPCLDFYDTLGWNAVTAPWCARDFTGETLGQVDTLHFSDAIGPRVGRMVANFIKTYY